MAERTDWIGAWAKRIEGWPKLVRMALSLVFAAALAVLVFVPLDLLVFDSAEGSNITLATIVMLGIGVALYVVGWWALMGFDDDPRQEWHAGPPAVWVTLLAALGTAVVIALALVALASLG